MEKNLDTLRHSASHVMAHAVCELFKEVKLTIGPSTDDGFYYDFDRTERFSEEDLKKIEARMKDLVKEDLNFESFILAKDEAIDSFARKGENLKVELIQEKAGEQLSCYRLGDVVDFCTGPHLSSTGLIDPETFRVLNVAGSYWKGDENNRQLQRIYGTAFLSPEDLAGEITKLLTDKEKRDSISNSARSLSVPDAAARLADEVITLARGKDGR